MAIFLKEMTILGNFLGKNVKFLAIFFEKMSSFWQFFVSQMAIFLKVRSKCLKHQECQISLKLDQVGTK